RCRAIYTLSLHDALPIYGSVHGPGYSGGEGITGSYPHPTGGAFADDFHVYAVDWTPDSITWSVDGVAYQTITPADLGGNEWVFRSEEHTSELQSREKLVC